MDEGAERCPNGHGRTILTCQTAAVLEALERVAGFAPSHWHPERAGVDLWPAAPTDRLPLQQMRP